MALLWKETARGLYERPLGTSEMGMSSLTASTRDREPLRIQAWAELTAQYPMDAVCAAFRAAWCALRLLKSPDVATTFGEGKKYYQVPSMDDLDSWVNRTFAIEDIGTSIDAAIAKSHKKFEPLPLLKILPGKLTASRNFKGSVLLLISHWRTEASGAYKMLDQLFDYAVDIITGTATSEALSKHVFGDETKLLTPVAEDIWVPNTETSVEAKARVSAHFNHYYLNLPSIDFPVTGDLSAPPINDGAYQRVYTTGSTRFIVNACKKFSISVTSAIHSAYLGAIYTIAPAEKRSRPYASLMPVQVRKRLPSTSPFRENGAWDAARVLMLVVPAGLDFLFRAQSLSKQYALANTDSWLKEDMRETSRQLGAPPDGVPPTSPSMPWFTSFGVLDDGIIRPDHSGFEIERVAAWADNVGPGIVLTAWTFKGHLNVQISWNLAYHSREQILQVLDLIDGELKKGLGAEIVLEETRGLERMY